MTRAQYEKKWANNADALFLEHCAEYFFNIGLMVKFNNLTELAKDLRKLRKRKRKK